MGTLYLVRHGQASFGADDYDQLSELGQRQCRALGDYLRERVPAVAAVMRGTLRRHDQSLQALAQGYGGALPEVQVKPELNEYDSEALIRALPGDPLPPPQTPEGYRAHFRRLRQALQAWMAGEIDPSGMPRYADFRAGVAHTLDQVRAHHPDGVVLVLSSGGPIATAVSQVMQAPPAASIDLNMRMRNSSVTEFVVSPRRVELVAFNMVPHLDTLERRAWISHA